ncbi:Transcriptional activator protein LasR [Pseudomonas sp. IT-P74]|uniref:Transcriptional activator protein LasR n=1 Tax=Pseudomonas fluorescens TaxID=294 RepID=A0A5E7UAC3_PSEFL|nr:Transcriptional activator protein LasR [Pseudomonas sp. ACN8]VVQ07305.1 Transcriptional activator protein LasR [Pseudomonas fluorescens]
MKTQQSLDISVEDAPSRAMYAPPVQLTAKETQALEWCLKGKTSWEIARIQSCSESTINFHFSNIRRKFAVGSRNAAVFKALKSGAISVEPLQSRDIHEPD